MRLAHSNVGVGRPLPRAVEHKSVRKRDFEQEAMPHLAVLYRVARRLVRSPQDAEDLVAQTLYRAVRAWPRFHGEFVRSWLIAILRNEFRNTRRKVALESADLDLPDDIGDDGAFWATMQTYWDAETILFALDRLPEEYRLAVHLCDVETMSYDEAAAAMEVPIGTVRSRVHRGRARLRRLLGGGEAE